MKNESEKGGAELCSSFSSHSGWHRGPRERVLLLSHHVSVATSNYTMTRSVWRRTGWGVIAVLAISSFRLGVIMSWSWHVDREWSPGTTTTPWKYKPQNSLAALRPGPFVCKIWSCAIELSCCWRAVCGVMSQESLSARNSKKNQSP